MFRILIILATLLLFSPATAKHYNGSSWIDNDCKYYNGSSWVACTKKHYVSSTWNEIESGGGGGDPIAYEGGNNSESSSVSYTVQNAAAGIVICVSNGNSLASVSISGFTAAPDQYSTTSLYMRAYYKVNESSGAKTYSLSGGSYSFPTMIVQEFSGIATSNAFDDHNGDPNDPGTTFTTGTMTASTSKSLLAVCTVDYDGAAYTYNSGTKTQETSSDYASGGYKILSATGDDSVTGTRGSGSSENGGWGIILKGN